MLKRLATRIRASSVPGKGLHSEVGGREEQIIRHGQREENRAKTIR
jgi:hypothetical protein